MVSWPYLIGAALVCVYALLWIHQRRARALFGDVPGFPTLPLIGNMHQMLGSSQFIFKRLVEMTQIMEETTKPFLIWAGPCPVILVSDPEDVKAVTNTFVEKPYYYNFGRVWLGDGLVTASGAIWKRNIKKLSNSFSSVIVDGYQDVFNEQGHKLVMKLKGEVGSKPFNAMEKYLALTTLEAICQTALGVPRTECIVTANYYRAFNRAMELLLQRGLNLLYHPDFIYRFTFAKKELEKCVSVLHNVSETIMEKRKKEREEMKIIKGCIENKIEKGKIEFKSFLDILLELRELDPSLTDTWVRSEMNTIIVGGQETTATTLFYSLLMIGCKPRIQDQLFDEMKNIFGGSTRAVEKDDLARMRYCEAVIHETLRLFPPLPAVMRYADKQLELNSCTIPKRTACCINVYGAGRSKRLWGEDASEYRPERWLDGAPSHPAAFIAFSYGRRSCIGKKYSMALLKTILAHCVRELVIESKADRLQFKLDLALKPVCGHLMKIHLRK